MTRNRDLARGLGGADSTGVLGAENIPDATLTTDVYDSVGLLPVSPAGTIAYTTSTTNPYVSVGNGWARLSSSNTAPTISSVTFPDGTEFTHPMVGSANTLRAVVNATDPDGLRIQSYDYILGTGSSDLFTLTGQSGDTFSFTRTASVSAQSRTFALQASDGIATTSSSTQTFTLGDDVYHTSVTNIFRVTTLALGQYASQVRISFEPDNPNSDLSGLESSFPSSITFRSILMKNSSGTTVCSIQMPGTTTYNSSGDQRYTFSNTSVAYLDFLWLYHSYTADPIVTVINGTVTPSGGGGGDNITSPNLEYDPPFGTTGVNTFDFHNSTVAGATTGNRVFTYTFNE